MRCSGFHQVFLFQYLASSLIKYSFKITSRVLFCCGFELARGAFRVQVVEKRWAILHHQVQICNPAWRQICRDWSSNDQFYGTIISVCCLQFFQLYRSRRAFFQVVKSNSGFKTSASNHECHTKLINGFLCQFHQHLLIIKLNAQNIASGQNDQWEKLAI